MSEKSWFLYGAQGTGKSRLSMKLAKKLGLTKIVDPWMQGDPIQHNDVLYICQVPPANVRRVMHIEFAKRLTRVGDAK
jgi:DNA replication protein DnaC